MQCSRSQPGERAPWRASFVICHNILRVKLRVVIYNVHGASTLILTAYTVIGYFAWRHVGRPNKSFVLTHSVVFYEPYQYTTQNQLPRVAKSINVGGLKPKTNMEESKTTKCHSAKNASMSNFLHETKPKEKVLTLSLYCDVDAK